MVIRTWVALMVALMVLVPLAGPMAAVMAGRVFEEVVEEEVKFLHESSAQVRRGRQKRQPPQRRLDRLPVSGRAPAGYESLAKPHCFWFSPPPLLRAPPALV